MKARFVSLLAASLTLGLALTACGRGGDQGALPTYTAGGSTPAASRPATTPTKPSTTGPDSGSDLLAPHSTHIYGGLKFVVNLPTDIPVALRPSLLFFAEFLQADGRSTALDKLDPSLSGMASAEVVKDFKEAMVASSVAGIGSVTYTVYTIQTAGKAGSALIGGCVDQSKLAHVRKDGSHFVAQARIYPTLKMGAVVSSSKGDLKVIRLVFPTGRC